MTSSTQIVPAAGAIATWTYPSSRWARSAAASPRPGRTTGPDGRTPVALTAAPARRGLRARSTLDALITAAEPDVRRAVRWNQPFYGFGASGFHLAFRCCTTYVQVQFLRGSSLEPQPPKASKHPEVRYLDIREDEELDEARFSARLEQSAGLPGDTL